MTISYDGVKNERNINLRGISFEAASEFDWIGDRLHVLVFTPRGGAVHVISLRKANSREVKRYEAQS